MKSRFLLASASALAVACALASTAHAADLGLAPLYKSPFVPNSKGGWYVCVGTSAGVANANVGGTNLFAAGLVGGSLVADGASVDGCGGYIKNGGPLGTWWRAEAGASYQNISGGNVAGSFSSHWRAYQEGDVGADIFASVLQYVGNVGNVSTVFSALNGFVPMLPSNVSVVGTPRQYVGFILQESQLNGNFGAAQGQTWAVAPGVKTGWIWELPGKDGKPNGNALEVYAQVTWPTQGFTANNVLAANGTPITVGAGVHEGAEYRAGFKYDFGL